MNTKKCLICNLGKKNDVLYWHIDKETGEIWCWCNKCDRGYSLYDYCNKANISLADFLKGEFDFKESTPNEVRKVEWPAWYVPLSDTRAQKGVDYVLSRGLTLEGDMYYDIDREGIVFPYYFQDIFVGGQTRFLVPYMKDGKEHKIDTMPGTRLGLVFYNWNQGRFASNVKGVFVCEGAFNALSIQQALNSIYGGVYTNPWRAIACSGAGLSKHQAEALKELKESGIKVIAAPDSDEAGFEMLAKMSKEECISHYVLTRDTEKDWNDLLKEMGNTEFAKFVIKSVQAV